LPWCAGVPVRRACRTGTVPLAVELIEGHGAGVPLEYSIEWLTCAVASRLDAVMVG
jgi:hypothetical protein